jgi:SHS2 domain-containing protein
MQTIATKAAMIAATTPPAHSLRASIGRLPMPMDSAMSAPSHGRLLILRGGGRRTSPPAGEIAAPTHPERMVSRPGPDPTMSRMRTRDGEPPQVEPPQVEPLHSDGLRIQAWAPTREACLAEAVHALVVSFVGGVPSSASAVQFDVLGRSDTDLLTGVLRTVIQRVRVWHQVPVTTDVVPTARGLRLHCVVVDAGAVVPVGAVPKGVSTTGVRCEPWPGGWWCGASVDL